MHIWSLDHSQNFLSNSSSLTYWAIVLLFTFISYLTFEGNYFKILLFCDFTFFMGLTLTTCIRRLYKLGVNVDCPMYVIFLCMNKGCNTNCKISSNPLDTWRCIANRQKLLSDLNQKWLGRERLLRLYWVLLGANQVEMRCDL